MKKLPLPLRTGRICIDPYLPAQEIRVALKRYWQDEKTYVETLKILPEIESAILTYTFEGDNLTVDVEYSMGGYAFQMKGEMIDKLDCVRTGASRTGTMPQAIDSQIF